MLYSEQNKGEPPFVHFGLIDNMTTSENQSQNTPAAIPWRDKLSSTLVSILLTALGAVAFQSAKYVAIDYWAEERASLAQIEQRSRDLKKWSTYHHAFDEIAKKVRERNKQRSALITSNIPPQAKITSSYGKFSKALFDAYDDFGAISHAPILDQEMETTRKITTEETQATIDGLEILTDMSIEKPPLSLDRRLKAANALEKTSRRFVSALSGSISVYEANKLAADAKDADWKIQDERAAQEHKDRDFWFFVRLGLAAISIIAWIELVFSLNPKREGKSKSGKQVATAAGS
jgi:hypothetical protein